MNTQSHNTANTDLERDTELKEIWQPAALEKWYTSTPYGRYVELLYHFLKEGEMYLVTITLRSSYVNDVPSYSGYF